MTRQICARCHVTLVMYICRDLEPPLYGEARMRLFQREAVGFLHEVELDVDDTWDGCPCGHPDSQQLPLDNPLDFRQRVDIPGILNDCPAGSQVDHRIDTLPTGRLAFRQVVDLTHFEDTGVSHLRGVDR